MHNRYDGTDFVTNQFYSTINLESVRPVDTVKA
jgi:hypothetical protein